MLATRHNSVTCHVPSGFVWLISKCLEIFICSLHLYQSMLCQSCVCVYVLYIACCVFSTSNCLPVSVGLTVERFVTIMLSKMSARDEDEHIRQMFLAFDMQCVSLSPYHLNQFSTVSFYITCHHFNDYFSCLSKQINITRTVSVLQYCVQL